MQEDYIFGSQANVIKMNDEMSKQSDRHATAKDWASDGRRAAGMVFGSISELSAASKSLAVFLLAGKLRS